MTTVPFSRAALVVALALGASACATPYTGPVEVTRFVAEDATELGTGSIGTRDDSEKSPLGASSTFENAVERQLGELGYTVNPRSQANHMASIRVEQASIDGSGRRSPINVGVGGSTGSYGSGVGLGIGINLGGGAKPRVVTTLSVRITESPGGNSLWEGRAELVTSTDSALADPVANAEVLAAALFRDFPGGNGETVTLDIDEIQETE